MSDSLLLIHRQVVHKNCYIEHSLVLLGLLSSAPSKPRYIDRVPYFSNLAENPFDLMLKIWINLASFT